MISNKEIDLIQSYHDKCTDMTEKILLDNILQEMQYRVPSNRIRIGSSCPRCNTLLDSNSLFCKYCGQSID